MGRHLSAYIEVDHGDCSPPFSDPDQIFSLTEGSFVFDKAYAIFDAIAGAWEGAERYALCMPLRPVGLHQCIPFFLHGIGKSWLNRPSSPNGVVPGQLSGPGSEQAC